MLKKVFFSVVFLSFLVSSAYPADNTIVVTATKTKAKIAKTPSQVNVISQRKLKETDTMFIENALKDVPGISVSSSGAFGGAAGIYLRGLPTDYTKTLMDGVDISDPSLVQPYYDFANLLSSGIQRVEIVQGAQSGLYGSNAIGGVINVITPKGRGKPHLQYSQTYGSYETFRETADFSGIINNFSIYLETTRYDTGGTSKMDKYNQKNKSYSKGDEDDGYHQVQGNGRIEFNSRDELTVGLTFNAYQTRNYLDSGYPPNDAAPSNNTPKARSYRENAHFFTGKLYLTKKFKNFELSLNTFYMQNLRYYKSNPYGDNNFKGKRWGSDMRATYKLNNTKITAGLNQQMEKYEDSTSFKKLRYNYAGFAEIQQQISNLILQGVARDDMYKTFGKHFTYKLGADYLITSTNTILKADYGTGFRAPSIYELYAPALPAWGFLGGNRDLEPEKAKTWSFGLTQNLLNNKIVLNAIYFKSIIKDRIQYFINPSTWQSTYKNAKGKTTSDGFEIGCKINPKKFLEAGANYTYTASKDPKTRMQAARIPLRVYTGYITLKALNNKLTSTLDGKYIGKRFDDSSHKYQTGKYTVFDFTVIYKPVENLETSCSVKNIFDRFYEEVYGYSTLPRSVFATISYKF